MPTILAVIPAREAAQRFPGKPLADLNGRPLVQWVYDAAASCSAFSEVIVATESEAIAERVRGFGGQVELTSPDHPSGTDRVAEVAERHPEAEVVANVQGDQPFATAEMLTALVQPYLDGEAPPMTTLACPLEDPAWWDDPNVVKVVRGVNGYALYFSRSPIPYGAADEGSHVKPLHHLGLYAFTRETLLALPDARADAARASGAPGAAARARARDPDPRLRHRAAGARGEHARGPRRPLSGSCNRKPRR